jgi:galactokinase/mevalonate kinase-like predicted kinase
MDKAHGRDRGAFSIADIPGGTGLGSSSAFTVGLLAALDPYGENLWTANIASQIEIEACRSPSASRISTRQHTAG